MKQLRSVLVLLLVTFTIGVLSAKSGNDSTWVPPDPPDDLPSSPPFDEEIAIRDVCDNVRPERERSLLPTAYAVVDDGYLTVYLTTYIGEATVILEDLVTGEVREEKFNSAYKFEVTFSDQLVQGEYKLKIFGTNGYIGEAIF